jgi:hypothetical protein
LLLYNKRKKCLITLIIKFNLYWQLKYLVLLGGLALGGLALGGFALSGGCDGLALGGFTFNTAFLAGRG